MKAGGVTPFFQGGTIDNTAGKITNLSAARFSGGVSGTGRLFSVTFMAKTTGDAQVTLTNLYAANSALEAIPVSPPEIVITVADQSDSDVADQSDSDVEDQSDSDVDSDQSDSDVVTPFFQDSTIDNTAGINLTRM